MTRHQGRHAARHAAPPARRRMRGGDWRLRAWMPRGSTAPPALFSLALVAAAVAAVVAVPSSPETALTGEQSEVALVQETEMLRATREDTARLVAERIDYASSRSAQRALAHEQEAETAAMVDRSTEQTQEWLSTERARRSAEDTVNAILEPEAAQENPQAAAQLLMPEFGFTGEGQWQCLVNLWTGESDWRWSAENPSSGAYGIPQSLPADKMASAGADWRTNPVTQIRWGLEYIKLSYGTPCGAWEFWQSQSPHWY